MKFLYITTFGLVFAAVVTLSPYPLNAILILSALVVIVLGFIADTVRIIQRVLRRRNPTVVIYHETKDPTAPDDETIEGNYRRLS